MLPSFRRETTIFSAVGFQRQSHSWESDASPSGMSLSAFLSSLPPPHPNSPTDIAIALASKYLVILSLLTPPTPFYKLLRAGIVAPLVIAGFAYSAYWPIQKDYEDVWGT